MNWKALYTLWLGLTIGTSTPGWAASWELGAYGGVTLPRMTDIRQQIPAQATDLTWQHAYAHAGGTWGVLATRWHPWAGFSWGVQAEVQRFDFDLKNQHNIRTFTKHGKTITNDEDLNPHRTDVTLLGINLLVRKDWRWAKPYVGGGGGMALADTRSWNYFNESVWPSDQSDLSPAPFWQVLGGVQVPLVGGWSLFSQYKFTHSSHRFDFSGATTSWTIEAHHVLGGISYTFH